MLVYPSHSFGFGLTLPVGEVKILFSYFWPRDLTKVLEDTKYPIHRTCMTFSQYMYKTVNSINHYKTTLLCLYQKINIVQINFLPSFKMAIVLMSPIGVPWEVIGNRKYLFC